MNARALLLAGLAALSINAFAKKPEDYQGKKMPSFRMTDTNGKVWTNDTLKGKVVLIDFWATWCPPCKAATPALQKLHAKYGTKGLVVIGADTWERGADAQKTAAIQFAKQNGLKYHMTLLNDKFAESLGIEGIPTMFILDKKGMVHKVQVGYDDAEAPILEKTVAGLLKS